MSCNLAEIGYGNSNYNFAESFILGKDYGGVSFIGNTGPGEISESSKLIQQMLNQVYNCYTSKLTIPYTGNIFKNGIIAAANITFKHVKAVIGIFSDPLVPLWMKTPIKSSTNGIFNPASLAIKESVNYAKCYLSDNSTENGVGIIGDFKGITETNNFTLINSRTDMLPFIHPVKISGLTVNQDRYWFMGKARFTSSGSQNSIKINSGKKITIEAMGEIELSGNILLETGSRMNLNSYRSISMNNCKFKDSGDLNVDAASKVVIGRGTEIPKGFSLTISEPK